MSTYSERLTRRIQAPAPPAVRDRRRRCGWIVALGLGVMIGGFAVTTLWDATRLPGGRFALLPMWFVFVYASALPHLLESSIKPFRPSPPRYANDSIVIPGDHASIALVTTGALMWLLVVGTIIASFFVEDLVHGT